jgi:hypothetical protein
MSRPNNTADVSTVRGVVGGYFFYLPSADAESVLPTNLTTPLDASWINGGFISEDGFTESLDSDTPDPIVDMNATTVDQPSGTHTETIELTLISINKDSLGLEHGIANVTDENGMLTAVHDWSTAFDTEYSLVFELVLKNGRRWRKVVKHAKVTELGDFEGKSDSVGGRSVKLTYLNGAAYDNVKDIFESTETELDLESMTVPELTAYAESLGITVPSGATKAEIIDLINNH